MDTLAEVLQTQTVAAGNVVLVTTQPVALYPSYADADRSQCGSRKNSVAGYMRRAG